MARAASPTTRSAAASPSRRPSRRLGGLRRPCGSSSPAPPASSASTSRARCCARGDAVAGFDNVNDYYDPALKEARLAELDRAAAAGRRLALPARRPRRPRRGRRPPSPRRRFDRVIHLAAQAGVRYSLENPLAYVESNLIGFTHILEACRHAGVAAPRPSPRPRASTAPTPRCPSARRQGVDHPLQFYAATKRANELMAHAYAHLYRLPCTGLRFFTVYGPWGRPDMAPMIFANAIPEGRPIQLFNDGRHSRDFTYVDDIVEGVIRAADRPARPTRTGTRPTPTRRPRTRRSASTTSATARPVELADFIAALERALGRPAIRELLPLQPGDVPDTFADTRAPRPRDRLAPGHPGRRGRAPLRRLVPRLPGGLGAGARLGLAGPAGTRQEGIARSQPSRRPADDRHCRAADRAAGAARPRHAPQRHLGHRRPAGEARARAWRGPRSGPTRTTPGATGNRSRSSSLHNRLLAEAGSAWDDWGRLDPSAWRRRRRRRARRGLHGGVRRRSRSRC